MDTVSHRRKHQISGSFGYYLAARIEIWSVSMVESSSKTVIVTFPRYVGQSIKRDDLQYLINGYSHASPKREVDYAHYNAVYSALPIP